MNGVDILTVQDNTVACGEGTAVYDPDTNTLTLNDAHITTAYNLISGIYAEGDLDIVLNGDNTRLGSSGGSPTTLTFLVNRLSSNFGS